jgi:glycosyltransferase involved in cell wall biosynthesis
MSSRVTVVVVSRDRREELRRALQSVTRQSLDCELIVVDDGSADGTADLVRDEFPTALLYSHRESAGPMSRRTEAVAAARTEIVVSLDDDAWFRSTDTLAEIVESFDEGGPQIGAVALPASDDPVRLTTERGVVRVTGLFRGGAAAFRRAAFLEAGGFRPLLRITGGERDLALRLLDAGYLIRVAWLSAPLGHRPSATRDVRERDRMGRRNDLLIGWLDVPATSLPGYLARMLTHALSLAVRSKRPGAMARGVVEGMAACLAYRSLRDPVTRSTYRLSRVLTGHAVPLETVLVPESR